MNSSRGLLLFCPQSTVKMGLARSTKSHDGRFSLAKHAVAPCPRRTFWSGRTVFTNESDQLGSRSKPAAAPGNGWGLFRTRRRCPCAVCTRVRGRAVAGASTLEVEDAPLSQLLLQLLDAGDVPLLLLLLELPSSSTLASPGQNGQTSSVQRSKPNRSSVAFQWPEQCRSGSSRRAQGLGRVVDSRNES